MEDKLIMGIDAGTSSIKVVLFDINGREVYSCSKKNVVVNKGSHYEQSMDLLWTKVSEAIKDIIHNNKVDPSNILSIGIAGQGEGCWLINEAGEPVRDAILWCDGRSSNLVDEVKAKESVSNRIREISGSVLFPGASTAVIMWLKKYEPEALGKAKYLLFCKDWIRFKLTGRVGMELTDASTSLLDLKDKKPSRELFEILNIEDCFRLIPEVSQSGELAGLVSKEAAAMTGLSEGTPVVFGMMDIISGAVGMGAVNANECCTLIGTTICNEVVRRDYTASDGFTSGFECHGVEGLYLNVIAPMAGTPNLEWIINNFFQAEKQEAINKNIDLYGLLEEKIKEVPIGSRGVIYLPYISSSGERAPFYDPNARAEFFGLSEEADKYTMLRSVYEGITFAIKDSLNHIENLNTIYLGGGGAKSAYWATMIADCTGKEVIIPDGAEFTAKGAALVAGVYCGIYRDLNEAIGKSLRVKTIIKPNKNNMKIYDNLYKLYKLIRISNKELWKLRKEIYAEIE